MWSVTQPAMNFFGLLLTDSSRDHYFALGKRVRSEITQLISGYIHHPTKFRYNDSKNLSVTLLPVDSIHLSFPFKHRVIKFSVFV